MFLLTFAYYNTYLFLKSKTNTKLKKNRIRCFTETLSWPRLVLYAHLAFYNRRK